MPDLVAIDLPGGPAFVDALRRVWDDGDAAFPVDQRLPPAGRQRVLAAMAPARVVTAAGSMPRAGGRPTEPGDALVIATSGTSGDPKGVVLTHDAVRASAVATSARLMVAEPDHWLACLPLSHVGGLSVVTRALVAGTALTVHPAFDATAVEQAARDGATLVSLVPTALARIDADLFRLIVLGGSRPPSDRPDNTVTTYGMTETGSGVVYDGRALDGVEIRIADDGEVSVRGPMLLRAYRDGHDPKSPEGWFPTGDLGHWRPDGRLHVEGRRGDLIITGGENVWPEAVEAILSGHPDVADVAVCGLPDAEWGEAVTALIVPSAEGRIPSLDDLRGLAKEHLPAFCAPRRIIAVISLPRTSLGKLRRAELLSLTATSRIAPVATI